MSSDISHFERSLIAIRENRAAEIEHFYGLDGPAASALVAALAVNTSLTSLWLKQCDITRLGDAVGVICRHSTLCKLKISYSLRDCEAEAISALLEQSTNLRSLDLDDNEIGAAGARAVARLLERNTTLLELSLATDTLTDAGVGALAAMLEKSKSVESLCLRLLSPGVTSESYHAISKALCQNSSLRSLTLSRGACNRAGVIDSTGAQVLAAALKINKSLQSLDLSYQKIGDEGARAIGQLLQAPNVQLRSLNLRSNPISIVGLREIAAALEKNSSLESLDLSRLEICDEGARVLGCALQKNSHLKSLELKENKIGAEGSRNLLNLIPVGGTLEMLNLEGNKGGRSRSDRRVAYASGNRSMSVHYWATLCADNPPPPGLRCRWEDDERLFQFVSEGDIASLRTQPLAVLQSARSEYRWTFGGTLLHCAALRGNPEMIIFLYECGLDERTMNFRNECARDMARDKLQFDEILSRAPLPLLVQLARDPSSLISRIPVDIQRIIGDFFYGFHCARVWSELTAARPGH